MKRPMKTAIIIEGPAEVEGRFGPGSLIPAGWFSIADPHGKEIFGEIFPSAKMAALHAKKHGYKIEKTKAKKAKNPAVVHSRKEQAITYSLGYSYIKKLLSLGKTKDDYAATSRLESGLGTFADLRRAAGLLESHDPRIAAGLLKMLRADLEMIREDTKKIRQKKSVNPSVVCPRNVALLGLVTLIEYKAPGGRSHVLKFPGRHQKQTAKKQFCLMLGEPKKRAVFASSKQRLLGHDDPARSTAPARSLLKSWAKYAATNVLKLEVADLKCATLIGEVVAIEYESQKWTGTTWTLYRHEFDRPADLYRSKNGGLYGIVRRDGKTIVTPRGIVG